MASIGGPLLRRRRLILETAREFPALDTVHESRDKGQPNDLTEGESTIRID